MSYMLEPALLRDLTESKAALARHGIVIIRAVETELVPAVMAEVRVSLESSPRKLEQLKDADLDRFMEQLREATTKSSEELRDLYTRLLAKLGTEYLVELTKELEGIDQLFKWERIARTVEPVNKLLDAKGFRPIGLAGPGDLSEGFKLELEDKWNASFARFKMIAEQAAEEIARHESEEAVLPAQAKPRKRKR